MSISPARPDVLALLDNQQRNYNAQLGQNHESLSKLYRKLAKIENVLAAEHERPMKRSCRKKWKWSQMLTKKSIASVQERQDVLHQHLEQCISLIGSYNEQILMSPPTPWGNLPPSPYLLTPSTPFPFSPWAANFSGANSSEDSETAYWDLSRLREPSPFSSVADSGYYELGSATPTNAGPSFRELDQIFSFGLLSTAEDNVGNAPCAPIVTSSSPPIMIEEEGSSTKLQVPSSPTRSGAQTHRRCVSAEVAQMINGGLDMPSYAKRGTSVGPTNQARDGYNGLVG